MPTDQERRTQRRFDLQLPVQVRVPLDAEEQEETSTRDISARGIRFTFSQKLEPGSELECVVTLPPEICQGNNIRVRILGRIVRSDPAGPEGRTGVVATIERYEFLRSGS